MHAHVLVHTQLCLSRVTPEPLSSTGAVGAAAFAGVKQKFLVRSLPGLYLQVLAKYHCWDRWLLGAPEEDQGSPQCMSCL